MSALLEIIAFFVDHGVWVAAGSALAVGVAMLAQFFIATRGAKSRLTSLRLLSPWRSDTTYTIEDIFGDKAGHAAKSGDDNTFLTAVSRERNAAVFTFPTFNKDTQAAQSGRDPAATKQFIHHFTRELRKLDQGKEIVLILNDAIDADISDVRWCTRILMARSGKTTVSIPFRLSGAACLIALAADEILMSPDATLVFDPDHIRHTLIAAKLKGTRHASDLALLDLFQLQQRIRETSWLVAIILRARKVRRWRRIARDISTGRYTDSTPARFSDLRRWGLRVIPIDPSASKTVTEASLSRRPVPTASHDTQDIVLGELPVCSQACPAGEVRDAMRALEQRRGTRLISIIHEEGMSEDSVGESTIAEALRAIRLTPAGTDLDIILHTPGGEALGAAQLVRALKDHKGRKTVFVPYMAFSAGTILALTADQIFLSKIASLGPIDVQITPPRARKLSLRVNKPENNLDEIEINYIQHEIGSRPAAALKSLLQHKRPRDIDDQLLEYAVYARDRIPEDHARAVASMRGNYSRARAERIARTLNDGYLSHGFPLMYEEARKIGLNVKLGVPDEVFTIVDSFRSSGNGFCSVIHCPD